MRSVLTVVIDRNYSYEAAVPVCAFSSAVSILTVN